MLQLFAAKRLAEGFFKRFVFTHEGNRLHAA
jgi:hypothetical protein